jgi:hypothetical protein
MTTITTTVTYQTEALYKGRPIVVELHPRHMTVRQKGKHDSISIGYQAIYETAWKIQWLLLRGAKS